jgi:long-subunit acyl-CoA synthetase (AMP-forming)
MNSNILTGQKLIRLSDGETIENNHLEQEIEQQCHYVEYAIVSTEKEDYKIAIIFPNTFQLDHPDFRKTIEEGCFCPKNINELSHCLSSCIKLVNQRNKENKEQVKIAAIIDPKIISKNADGSIDETKILEDCRSYLKEALNNKAYKQDNIYIMWF